MIYFLLFQSVDDLWQDYLQKLQDHVQDPLTKYLSCIPQIKVCIYRILGECLLISSLPCKALRRLVESRGLPRDSTCILEALPGKLDIKRHEPGILFIMQFTHWFTLLTSDYDVISDFCMDSASLASSFKKCNVYMT